jgi:hypothetical protein
MKRLLTALLFSFTAAAQTLPFLTDEEVTALAAEISGETAKRNLEGFSRQHRMRGSEGFDNATSQILAELKRYGYEDATLLRFPADGTIFYGTQRSRPAWNARAAELWEIDNEGRRVMRLASWEAAPITLAQDSESADIVATLVDIGNGTSEKDYEGREVKGKIVLTSSQPGAVSSLAVGKFGAAGIVSYAQNQRTAWYGEDESLVRWGHLETFAPEKTFGFMISLETARALQARLARGETIRLHATVDAGQEAGSYDIATATIRGSALPEEEIIFSCHLDHPRPGANDNASGCAAILEVARSLSKLIKEKRIDPPRRTIRFVWPPEIEGTLALLNGRPDLAQRIRAAIHLDMVGGGPETKAIFHVTRGPASQPSFIYDIAATIGRFVNEQTAEFAGSGKARWPLVAPEGGKEALLAALVPLTLGSDHQVYSDSSFGIPAIYLNDWPDRYIHTNFDVAANIDPTKLKRAAFIAGASGYVLASLDASDAVVIEKLLRTEALDRASKALARGSDEGLRFASWYEREMMRSLERYLGIRTNSSEYLARLDALLGTPKSKTPTGRIYRRNPAVKGPMSAFGYDYFRDRYTKPIRLGGEYQYEALNLVDGRRTTSQITDALAAIYGPVSRKDVEQYLEALASIDVILPSDTAP